MPTLSNTIGKTSKLRITYSPRRLQPLVSYKIKIFVNSQLVECFSSKDTISIVIPIQPGHTTITIKAAWKKQTIKSTIETSREYSLNIKYSYSSGKWKGRLSLSNHDTGQPGISSSGVDKSQIGDIEYRNKTNWRLAIALCLAVLIGIVGYPIINPSGNRKHTNPPARDMIRCKKCGGTGKNPTPLIHRDMIRLTISDDCDFCGGRGWIRRDLLPVPSPTPTPDPDKYMECVVCHGDKDCQSCAGRGKHIRENPYSLAERIETDCDECHGSGRCKWCHGKGKTLNR